MSAKIGTIIQGGTCNRKIGALKDKLKGSPNWDVAFLFPDKHGVVPGHKLGSVRSDNRNDFIKIAMHNHVFPVMLHDITTERAWTEDDIAYWFRMTNQALTCFEAGQTVVLACTAGKNRSTAMMYAINPTEANRALVRCPLMRCMAEAFHKNNREFTIGPLERPQPAVEPNGCDACATAMSNQEAHMHPGGCMDPDRVKNDEEPVDDEAPVDAEAPMDVEETKKRILANIAHSIFKFNVEHSQLAKRQR